MLLVTIDCLRSDHVGCYGYERPTTPTIDKLASEGVALNGISNSPGTRWALQSIHTGASHERFDGVGLPENRGLSLATRFQNEGYSTAGFAVNGFLTRDYGYHRGFDEFKDFKHFNAGTSDKARALIREHTPTFLVENLLKPVYYSFIESKNDGVFRPSVIDEDPVDEAIDWISKQSGDWFTWVHLMDAHTPYARWPEHLEAIRGDTNVDHVINPDYIEYGDSPSEAVIDAYDSGIRSADAQLSRLLQTIDDDTTVIVTGDHGEEFGRFGGFHHATIHSTMAQVPLVIRDPDLEYNDSGRIDKYAQHIDIAPTAMKSENIEPHNQWEGEELLSPPEQRPIYYRLKGKRQMDSWGVRMGEYKLILREGNEILMHSPYREHDEPTENYIIKNKLRKKSKHIETGVKITFSAAVKL